MFLHLTDLAPRLDNSLSDIGNDCISTFRFACRVENK
jgi:hypothetical protein